MNISNFNTAHLITIAPMIDCTDRHERYFLRLISKNVWLYTEMITTQAIIHGDRRRLLDFHPLEKPLALQLGGNDPQALASCSKIAEDFDYDEVNLNVGCPSTRVQSGQFGACLMLNPSQVTQCVYAMQKSVNIPVTVKCRIGVDDHDSYESLHGFIQQVSEAGCHLFIIHARKAWLSGLSPKENRTIPPLNYQVVYRLKNDFPHLTFILNGGLTTLQQVQEQLSIVDGIMIGRAAYANPYLLAEIEKKIFANPKLPTRHDVIAQLIPYVEQQLSQGVRLTRITRHLFGLFQGQYGGNRWRRFLSEHAHKSGVDASLLTQALSLIGAV